MTRYLFLVFAATALLSVGAQAQTKRTGKKASKTTAAKTTSTIPPLDVREARVKVSNQLANVSMFTAKLGPIAQAIEALDSEAKIKNVSTQSVDKNTENKQKVIKAIRDLREGIVKLESEFRVKPALKKYLPTIQGISELAGQSESSAIAGKFVAANAPLRTLEQKLTDTLAVMPKAEL
ncbi:MAG: hypothetical protein ABI481_11685 [Pyrinomonadaceae bacterium]